MQNLRDNTILIFYVICLIHYILPQAYNKNSLHLFMVNFPHEGISYNTRIIKNVIQNAMQIILNNYNVEMK